MVIEFFSQNLPSPIFPTWQKYFDAQVIRQDPLESFTPFRPAIGLDLKKLSCLKKVGQVLVDLMTGIYG
jgi:hypothetical protein